MNKVLTVCDECRKILEDHYEVTILRDKTSQNKCAFCDKKVGEWATQMVKIENKKGD